jgi:hypothetical protein
MTVLSVPFTVNAQSWQFVPPKLVIGVIVALIAKTGSPMIERAGWGLIYGVLLLALLCLHMWGISSPASCPHPRCAKHISHPF